MIVADSHAQAGLWKKSGSRMDRPRPEGGCNEHRNLKLLEALFVFQLLIPGR